MLLVGCDACRRAVYFDSSPWPEGACDMLNALELPCPQCGAIGRLGGMAARQPSSRKGAMNVARSLGWRWHVTAGGGFYGVIGPRAVTTTPEPPNLSAILTWAANRHSHGLGWMAALIRAATRVE